MSQALMLAEVIKGNEESSEVRDFIESSQNGTIFHRPAFFSYHGPAKFPPESYEWHHIAFRESGAIRGFLPGIIANEEGKRVYYSTLGASFGGLVSVESSFSSREKLLEAALEHILESDRISEIVITQAPSIYDEEMDDTLDYLYLSKGFQVIKSELLMASRVRCGGDFPRSIFKSRVKSSVNQSRRNGVTCRLSDDIDEAYSIIERDQAKFKKRPTHSLEELKRLNNIFPGRILFFTAHHESRPIAVVCLIKCNKNCCYTFYIDQLEEGSKHRPIDLIIEEVFKYASREKFGYVDFGPSTFGLEPHRSLIFFKEGFGGRGIKKATYSYKVKK